jgi:hypothetical protein
MVRKAKRELYAQDELQLTFRLADKEARKEAKRRKSQDAKGKKEEEVIDDVWEGAAIIERGLPPAMRSKKYNVVPDMEDKTMTAREEAAYKRAQQEFRAAYYESNGKARPEDFLSPSMRIRRPYQRRKQAPPIPIVPEGQEEMPLAFRLAMAQAERQAAQQKAATEAAKRSMPLTDDEREAYEEAQRAFRAAYYESQGGGLTADFLPIGRKPRHISITSEDVHHGDEDAPKPKRRRRTRAEDFDDEDDED